MRISDWSSDVCSSDLPVFAVGKQPFEHDRSGAGVDLVVHKDQRAVTKFMLAVARVGNDRQWLFGVLPSLVDGLERVPRNGEFDGNWVVLIYADQTRGVGGLADVAVGHPPGPPPP